MKNNFKSQNNNMERIREVENFVQYLNEQFYVLLANFKGVTRKIVKRNCKEGRMQINLEKCTFAFFNVFVLI